VANVEKKDKKIYSKGGAASVTSEKRIRKSLFTLF